MKVSDSRVQPARGGFSLVEVLVASTLLALSVCWSVLLTVQSRELSSLAEETNVAVGILETQFAECMSLTRQELTGGVLTPNEELQMEGILDGQSVLFETPGFEVGDEIPDVLEVRLTISWLGVDDRPRNITVSGLRR